MFDQISEVKQGALELQGIFFIQESPIAVINYKKFKVGDRIGNYIIDDIKKDFVILKDGNESLELRFEYRNK